MRSQKADGDAVIDCSWLGVAEPGDPVSENGTELDSPEVIT
jgi:hypothetical protein